MFAKTLNYYSNNSNILTNVVCRSCRVKNSALVSKIYSVKQRFASVANILLCLREEPCSLNMRFLLAGIMPPPPPNHTPVKKSTGRFGALQVRKVLSREHTNREKEIGKSNIHIITFLNNKIMSYWIKITAGINSLIFIFSYIDQCPDLHKATVRLSV
jgi:hypothetical protein